MQEVYSTRCTPIPTPLPPGKEVALLFKIPTNRRLGHVTEVRDLHRSHAMAFSDPPIEGADMRESYFHSFSRYCTVTMFALFTISDTRPSSSNWSCIGNGMVAIFCTRNRIHFNRVLCVFPGGVQLVGQTSLYVNVRGGQIAGSRTTVRYQLRSIASPFYECEQPERADSGVQANVSTALDASDMRPKN